jgi:hypothetical protein
MRIRIYAIMAAATLFPALSWGGDRPADRQKRQQVRIADGIKDGSLTRHEVRKIERREAKLQREIRRDRRDGGGLTARERVKIEAKQDALSGGIAKEKHDAQTRK